MARTTLYFDGGAEREPKTRYRQRGATRAATTMNAFPGDTLASITERAYGANTPELRARIMRANATLTGEINVPR